MSLIEHAIQFRLDGPTGPLVQTSLARTQQGIRRLLERLASQYVGREVHVVYPPGYPQ